MGSGDDGCCTRYGDTGADPGADCWMGRGGGDIGADPGADPGADCWMGRGGGDIGADPGEVDEAPRAPSRDVSPPSGVPS
jgi:hypothetical protein